MGGRSGNGGEGPRRKKYKLENERKREREKSWKRARWNDRFDNLPEISRVRR